MSELMALLAAFALSDPAVALSDSSSWPQLEVPSDECTCHGVGVHRDGVKPPEILKRVEPDGRNFERHPGKRYEPPILRAVITKAGEVRCIRVLRGSTETEWNRRFVDAIRQWRFRPATLGGEAVCCELFFSTIIHYR